MSTATADAEEAGDPHYLLSLLFSLLFTDSWTWNEYCNDNLFVYLSVNECNLPVDSTIGAYIISDMQVSALI